MYSTTSPTNRQERSSGNNPTNYKSDTNIRMPYFEMKVYSYIRTYS